MSAIPWTALSFVGGRGNTAHRGDSVLHSAGSTNEMGEWNDKDEL